MNLVMIKNELCPHCHAIVVRESCHSVHVNGQGFEEREFKCGHVLKWSPNFERLIVVRPCPGSPEEIAMNAADRLSSIALMEFIREMEARDEWKCRLIGHLPNNVKKHVDAMDFHDKLILEGL